MKTSLKFAVLLYSLLYCIILSAQVTDCSNSTEIQGCTDATACNFDPEATCDDGSCDFAEPCCPIPIFDEVFSTICSGESITCISFDGDVTEIFPVIDIVGEGQDFGFDDYFDPVSNEICFRMFVYQEGSCMPRDSEFTISYNCKNGNSYDFSLGIISVYPAVILFEPIVEPPSECGGVPTILPGLCGEVLLGEEIQPDNECAVLTAGSIDWTIDPLFDITDAPTCFIDDLSGSIEIAPCFEACCDGVICEESCLDLIVTLDGLPTEACSNETVLVTINILGLDASSGEYSFFVENNGGYDDFFYHYPGDPTSYATFLLPFNSSCEPETHEVRYDLICTDATLIETGLIGSFVVYPDLANFTPQITPSIACIQELEFTQPLCGALVLDPETIPSGCGVEDELVNWSVEYNFEYPSDCNIESISGTETVFACVGEESDLCDDNNLCPELVDVVVSGSGTYCSGDVALVCAEFSSPFTCYGEVIVNGVAAIAGENQVCFDLNLVNNTCSFKGIAIPFEVFCTIEETIDTAFTDLIAIAPDPSKWVLEVSQGDCRFPPNVAGYCFAEIVEIDITVPPVSGCPPQSGEAEVTLAYYDDDFDEIDISQFPCSGFSETVTTPILGCSDCPYPAEPTIISSDTDVCEGEIVEVCLAFAPGDEVNALGLKVFISGNLGSNHSEILTGDGTTLNHCLKFTPRFSPFSPFSAPPLECDPITEEYVITIFSSDYYLIVTDLGPFYATIYPELDKFAYITIPAKDNCPDAAKLPKVVSIGECDLDIQSAVTITPIDGCPGTVGEFTYSVNYLSPADFANAPADCAFMPVIDATEPIPACLTCPPCYGSISGTITIDDDCDENGGDVPSQPITVELYDGEEVLIATATTDPSGFYLFDSVFCGNYFIFVDETNFPCPQVASTNPIESAIENDGDNIVNQDFSFEPVPVFCNGTIDIEDIEICNTDIGSGQVGVDLVPVSCNADAEVDNLDGTLTVVAFDLYDESGVLINSSIESTTLNSSACDPLEILLPLNETCAPVTYDFSLITSIKTVTTDGAIIDSTDDPKCTTATFSVTIYPILTATDVSATDCGNRQVDLLAEDGTVCDSQIQVCVGNGGVLNADFSGTVENPLFCSTTLTMTTSACSDCGNCTTPVYNGCVCLVRACESNSIYVAELGADCSTDTPTPLLLGANSIFEWYLNGNLVGTNIGHPYFSPSSTGNYTVIITDDLISCQYWDTATPCTGIIIDEIIDCSDCGGE